MKRLATVLGTALLLGMLAAAPAKADFGLTDLQVTFTDSEGQPVTQAGSHPFALEISGEVNSLPGPKGWAQTEGAIRDLEVFSPEGLAGDPTAVPTCETLDFLSVEGGTPGCSDSSALGFITATLGNGATAPPGEIGPFPLYNLEPSPGTAAKLGFWVEGLTPVTIDAALEDQPPYRVFAAARNTPQILEFFKSFVTLWGNPADEAHDPQRGGCILSDEAADSCPANLSPRPFLTMPRSCTGPLSTVFKALAWWTGDPADPGPPAFFEDEALSQGMSGCAKLGFDPHLAAQATSTDADSPSGLHLNLEVSDEGLTDPEGTAHSDIEAMRVTLPQGMTANPSLAEGLQVCTEAQFASETASSPFGAGCPAASKIGTIEAETPLLREKTFEGTLFVAEPYRNPFNSLIALYVTVKDPALGIDVGLAGRVQPIEGGPEAGRLTTIFEGLPQVPLSDVRVRLREGARSPLVTPPACGTHTVEALFTPSARPETAFKATSSFQITRGPGGGACPPAGAAPFAPGFEAGSLNNDAGSFAPFAMRITRRDGDQDLTRFDATLPAGLTAKLAGVEKCSQAALEAAKAKSGLQERSAPSCPAASQIGTTQGGAGVGSQLTYVPGKLYLAGPFAGAPLSVAAIVPAVAGPFDVGTIVVQEALDLNPVTAEGEIDGARSDPIPHILAGIPLRVRDVQVFADRPQFALNPTSCAQKSVRAAIWGGGLNVFSAFDDTPVPRNAPYRAANCLELGFKPRLTINLKGGTKRGGHPALRSTFRPRAGDANLAEAIVRLPRSAFLDQAHIRTICTRVQFAAESCPKGATYGKVRAFTPLLEDPLEGPAILRSSSNDLPDLVFDLKGLVDIEASAQIDSLNGGIRASFRKVPDAPITKVVISMQGGDKGLIVNSRDLCGGTSRASVALTAHNTRKRNMRPVVRASCRKRAKR
jgi:hypothetical protein